MFEEMKVAFYKVERCGYYTYAQPQPAFGSLAGLMADVKKWSSGKALSDTRIDAASGDGDHLPVYLREIHESQSTFLLTAWNEVPADKEGYVASVPASAQVGSVQQVNNKIVPGTIPGYPTFFWILPARGLLATLRIDQRIAGQQAFQEYMQMFLATQSSHAVLKPQGQDGDGVTELWAYRASSKSNPVTDVAPRFHTVMYKNPGAIDTIIKRVDDIRRVHRRVDLELKNTSERALWQRALKVIGVTSVPDEPKKARFQANLSTLLTSAELKTLIKEWQDGAGNSEWDDCGFQFKGESEVHWLSGARASGEFQIDVTRDPNNGQIDTAKLLAGVLKMKTELLALLK